MNNLRNFFKPVLYVVTTPLLWVHPNIVSFGSFLAALPGFYFYAVGNTLGGSLFVLGAIFDAFDGTVATRTGKLFPFGGVWDATLDRVFEGFLFLSMGIGEVVSWEVLFVLYTSSVSVSYIKAKAEAVMKESKVGMNRFSVGIAQRGERILIIFLASIANYFIKIDGKENLIMEGAMIILAFLSFVTLAWRAIVIKNVVNSK